MISNGNLKREFYFEVDPDTADIVAYVMDSD